MTTVTTTRRPRNRHDLRQNYKVSFSPLAFTFSYEAALSFANSAYGKSVTDTIILKPTKNQTDESRKTSRIKTTVQQFMLEAS